MSTIAALTVIPSGDDSDFARPCVDCGYMTGNFCDGGITVEYDKCFAAKRIPSERWSSPSQRTPLCSLCEKRLKFCRFCRLIPSCTPPAWN